MSSLPRIAVPVALVLAGLVAVGCGSSSGAEVEPASAAPHPPGAMPPPCPVPDRDEPGDIPLGSVVDSATLVAELSQRWEPGWGRIAARLQIHEEEAGTRDGATVFAPVAEADLNWIRERLLEHRTETVLPDGPVSVVLADQGRLAPRTVRRLRFCAPRMLDSHRERFQTSFQEVRERFLDDLREGPLQARLLLQIDESGTPIDFRFDRRSRSILFDQAAMAIARTTRFTPGWTEGRPIRVWTSVPVELRIR